jgi:type IV secretion system protein VirB1
MVMKAIITTESKGNPLAINLNGYRNGRRIRLSYQPHSFSQAISWIKYLDQHDYNFDIGIAQVNIKNIHAFGLSATQALDICTNLQMASMILKHDYNNALKVVKNNQLAVRLAISAYNTGNYQTGFSNGYVNRVINNYKAINI